MAFSISVNAVWIVEVEKGKKHRNIFPNDLFFNNK